MIIFLDYFDRSCYYFSKLMLDFCAVNRGPLIPAQYDQDYALSPTTSGPQSPAGGCGPYKRHNYVRGFYTLQREDVNRDGVVNILDLNFVASMMGNSSPTTADVNRDGFVDILDLVKFAAAF